MRTTWFRMFLATAMVVGGTAAVPVPPPPVSPLVHVPLGAGAYVSDNLTYVGTLPVDSPGIGGRVLEVDGQQRLYVTGAKGLMIWDVTDPTLPWPLGALPLPHFQNEDVDVSDDGDTVIISTDTAAVDTDGRRGNGIRIIDTSDPTAPVLRGFVAESNHTTMCADPDCEWLYGSSGTIYDATDPDAPVATLGQWGSGGHALNRDASGLVISDSTPRRVLDVSDPEYPVTLTTGEVAEEFQPDGLLQHNNVRPRADEWVPREPGDDDPALRAGELLIGNSESNLRTACGGNAGGLSTWSMVDWNEGEPMEQLETFRPVNGTWADGNPAINALGCSGHWFTVRDDMIAASWYEHGVRVIAVDPATGAFDQRGFFQPVATEAGAAHWVSGPDGEEYIYSIDYARGIDILRFDRDAPAPTTAEFDASWLANLGRVGPAAEVERMFCRIGAGGTA